jgi:hypothetical protein
MRDLTPVKRRVPIADFCRNNEYVALELQNGRMRQSVILTAVAANKVAAHCGANETLLHPTLTRFELRR